MPRTSRPCPDSCPQPEARTTGLWPALGVRAGRSAWGGESGWLFCLLAPTLWVGPLQVWLSPLYRCGN